MATITENIKRLRTKQGLSQDDLARKAELKYSTLAKIEGDFVKKAWRSNGCQNSQSARRFR
jgi:transcriptional regulator with XRE-family HTH domain